MAKCQVQERMAEEQSIMTQDENTGQGQNEEVRIIRGRVDSLSLYEITDAELETLERGSPYSIYLNFAIFLLTLGLSFLTSLLTMDIQSQSTLLLIVYVGLTIVGIIVGAILIVLSRHARNEIAVVVKRIKGRIENSADMSDDSFDGDNS